MSLFEQIYLFSVARIEAAGRRRDDRGEVSATTVVLAASLIALALAVGVIITQKVRQKANSLDLG